VDLCADAHRSKVIRQALGPPSWADALKRTEIILAGFNPELAAARAAIEEKKQKGRTVQAACDLWIDRKKREFSVSLVEQYQSLTRHLVRWADCVLHVVDSADGQHLPACPHERASSAMSPAPTPNRSPISGYALAVVRATHGDYCGSEPGNRKAFTSRLPTGTPPAFAVSEILPAALLCFAGERALI
jgi:hypothetical protein